MRRALMIVALVAGMASCGDDGGSSSSSDSNGEIEKLLLANGAPDGEAACFAEELDGYSLADLEKFFAAGGAEDADTGIMAAFTTAAEKCSESNTAGSSADDAGADSDSSGSSDSATVGDAPAAVPLPGNVVAGTPVDDSFALDAAPSAGFGTVNSSCTQSFVAASGLDSSAAECIHVTSALSDWVAVVATVGTSNEVWMACSDDAGQYTFGLRWAGTVQGITPMDDATIGSGLVVSMVDDAQVVYHLVIWDQYEGSLCPTSTVEFPGTVGTGPMPTAGGVYLSLNDGDKGICYRPIDGAWTRGSAEGATC